MCRTSPAAVRPCRRLREASAPAQLREAPTEAKRIRVLCLSLPLSQCSIENLKVRAATSRWTQRPSFRHSKYFEDRTLEGSIMPRDSHTKAAEHHENAAKSHRTAAEHHGKGEHAKGNEESMKAQGHSKSAREHSEMAHGKSQSQK